MDRRGQSESLGVILLAMIVIVMAGAIGQFVFGLDIIQGKEQAVGPQISFDTTVQSNGDLVIEHASGNSVDTSILSIKVGEDTIVKKGETSFWNTEGVEDEWTASESITISNSDLDEGDVVRIIWESPTTSDSSVVLKFEYRP